MTDTRKAAASLALMAALTLAPQLSFAAAPDCPNNGQVRFGVEPYDTAAKLVPIYDKIGKLIAKRLDCEVRIFVTTSYNAEIEAMRVGKLEGGQFGPLGYVLAHQIAKAEVVAGFADKEGKLETYWASIVTWPGSGIKTLQDVKGKSFAFSDPTSTSGHLLPAYAFRKVNMNPEQDFKSLYAGSHTAAFEALRNRKVDATELNSQQITSATQRGAYKEGDVVFLWKSEPLPFDPITVRADLEPGFKKRFTDVLQTLDLSELPPEDVKILGSGGARMVKQVDSAYDLIRDLVKILNIDLAKLDS